MRRTWFVSSVIPATILSGPIPTAIAQQINGGRAPIVAPGSFPDIRGSFSTGLNPMLASPFVPDPRMPLSPGLNPLAVDPRNPLSIGLRQNGMSPFIPDIRNSLSGVVNPAAAVPFGTLGRGIPNLTNLIFPGMGSFSAFGTPISTPFFVAPSGAFVGTPLVTTVEVPVPVAVPVAVPVPAGQGQALTERDRPSRTTRRRAIVRDGTVEQRSLHSMRQLMARQPLTEATVVSLNADAVRVRFGASRAAGTQRYPRAQVFFFDNRGTLVRATETAWRLRPGNRVLVPERPLRPA